MPNSQKIVFLFDIDGTILLTGGAGTRALNQAFLKRYGVTDGMKGISCAGRTDPMIIADMFRQRLLREPSTDEVQELLVQYEQGLESEIIMDERFRIMPHAIETLLGLSKKEDVILGIATGNSKIGAKAKLSKIQCWELFSFGGYGDDAADRPGLVARAMEEARRLHGPLSNHQFVVIGDTHLDIIAARACGIRVIAVATGSISKEELIKYEPDAIFSTLGEFMPWFQEQRRMSESGGCVT